MILDKEDKLRVMEMAVSLAVVGVGDVDIIYSHICTALTKKDPGGPLSKREEPNEN